MTIREARDILPYWQERLGLTDWKISVYRGKPVDGIPRDWDKHEMYEHCVAISNWHAEEAIGLILLRKDAAEDALVHELLHIRLEGHSSRNRAYSEMYERGVNAIAAALVGGKKSCV